MPAVCSLQPDHSFSTLAASLVGVEPAEIAERQKKKKVWQFDAILA